MTFRKKGLHKQLFKIVTGVILFAISPIKQIHARDNEPVKTGVRTGIASLYHDKFHGRKTANGDIFSQKKLTCASNQYALGTWLKITNMLNGKSVLVRVNDRMNVKMKRVVDLSKAAAFAIGLDKKGLAKVSVENFGKIKPDFVF
jgi:rare lipoprotein A